MPTLYREEPLEAEAKKREVEEEELEAPEPGEFAQPSPAAPWLEHGHVVPVPSPKQKAVPTVPSEQPLVGAM